jgi:HK97 family phage portal protein
MRNPFRRKALTATPEVLDGIRNGSISPFPLLGGGSRQRIQDAYNTAQSANYAWIYSNSPAVSTVVDVIVRNIGQLDLRLYEEISESQREPRPEHPAALSLRYPNEETAADSFTRSMFKDFLLFDNAYSLMEPAPGNQVGFNRMPAHHVQVRGSSMFRAEGYRFWRRDGTFIDFEPEQVLHWHGENPHDPRIGLSKLDALRSVIAEDAALQQAVVELANSGLQAPAWVFRPLEAPEWSNQARKGFEEDLSNRIRRQNKHPVVLEEGMELRSFGVSPKDAEMMQVRRWAIEQVARAYGVPLGMVGLAENLEEARSQFYSDTLPPYCENYTRMLDQRLLVRVYGWTDGCYEFNLDEKHMGDDRIAALVSGSGRAVFTTNEARARLNLPPIDTGDELVTPLNVLVGDNPKPSPMVMPPQQPGEPAQDGSVRNEDNPKALLHAVTGALNGAIGGQVALQKAETFERLPQFHPTHKADLERQHQHIDRARSVVVKHYNRLQRGLMAKAQTDWEVWDKRFSDNIDDLMQEIVRTEGSIYAFKFASDFSMDRVEHYLRATADGFAKALNDVIRAEVEEFGAREALALRDRHIESFGAALGAKATIWAREEAARQAPGTASRTKTWIPDTQRHAEFGGMTVPIGASWPAGFAPGTAPGCKCTMSIE